MRAGGYRPPQLATDEVKMLIESLKSAIASRLGRTEAEIESLTAHSFISRAVLGGNFTVKTVLSNGEVIHVKANMLAGGPMLVAVATGFSMDSPIEPIE